MIHYKKNMVISAIITITIFIIVIIALQTQMSYSYKDYMSINFKSVLKKDIFEVVLLCIVCIIWHWSKAYLRVLFFSLGIFVSSIYIKKLCGMILIDNEIIHCLIFGTIIFSIISIVYWLKNYINSKRIQLICDFIVYISNTLFLLPALILWGYYVINGDLLSSATILTLFQTNANEVLSYLKNQNIFLWSIAFCILFIIIIIQIHLLKKMTFVGLKGKWIVIPFLIIYIVLSILYVLPRMKDFYTVQIILDTKSVLQEYNEYGQAKQEREERLRKLSNLRIIPSKSGIYVLIIGESESRDHMSLYGYDREDTPWLNSIANIPGNIVFYHAYSNHTHTIPVLTYALSEKNQYNNLEIGKANSIVEIAKAAGYDTYWISNQRKYGAWDTPVAEIASTSVHQNWLNGNVGISDMRSEYYDEALIDKIPDLTNIKNAFVVIHLMGSHEVYEDRYPKNYNKFFGKKTLVDQYDNSVLYNDEVLRKIYNKLSQYPNFMGFVYLSDHGDDADAGKGHDASRFTYAMSRIPLIMGFSKDFIQKNAQTYATLQVHNKHYWTNDMLYNLLIDIMGIEGAPYLEPNLDIASEQYNMTPNTLYTLHGQIKISDDPNIDK